VRSDAPGGSETARNASVRPLKDKGEATGAETTKLMKITNAKDIARCVSPGTHPAGQCLYLQVRAAPTDAERHRVTKRWIARITVKQATGKGRTRDMGLGSADDMKLSEARDRAFVLRQKARDGIDPIE
jgi:hypothetical protein